MAIKVLKERGSSASSIARAVGVTEGAVRLPLRRQVRGPGTGGVGSAAREAARQVRGTGRGSIGAACSTPQTRGARSARSAEGVAGPRARA